MQSSHPEWPKRFNPGKYNEQGRQIAARLRGLIPHDVVLEFLSIAPENREAGKFTVRMEKV